MSASIATKRTGKESVAFTRAAEGAGIRTDAVNSPLVSTSFVCVLGSGKYVIVTPEFVWLTPDNNNRENVGLLSNTDWHIVI